MKYQKPPLTYSEQLDLLLTRGLQVESKIEALHCLKNISYYRLSAYFLPFKQSEQFRKGTSFKDVIDLYTFDRKLRLLILDAIEPIEVALRTQIIYHLSHKYGAFGYLDEKNFSNRFKHAKWLQNLNESISDSTETFIKHYKKKYTLSTHFPFWMVIEVISFGNLSYFFRGLKGEDQQVIANIYNIKDIVLTSWLHALVYLRNLCAHHARLWNRTLTFKPALPQKSSIWQGVKNDNIYSLLVVMEYLLNEINSDSMWASRLQALLENYPQVSLTTMGFPKNWSDKMPWVK